MSKKTNWQRIEEARKKRQEENNSVSSTKTLSNFDKLEKSRFENSLNTLQTDLTTLSKTIGDVYNGWQTQETMKNTLSSVQSMYDRLGKYQEYQKKYGGVDLSELHTSYKNILDGWDGLSKLYGNYKNAEAFNSAKKTVQMDNDYTGLTFDEVQAKKKEYAKDSFEYDYFDNYTKYTDLNEFDKAIEAKKTKDNSSKFTMPDNLTLDATNKALDVNSFGKKKENPVLEEAFRVNAQKSIEGRNFAQTNDLETARNIWALDHAFDLHKDVMQNEDFAENSKYVSTRKNGRFGETYDATYEYINNIDGMRAKIDGTAFAQTDDVSEQQAKGYDELYPEEVRVYNYWNDYDRKNGTNKAQEFLDAMEITLTKRKYDKQTKSWEDYADSGAFQSAVASVASIPASVFGSIPTAVDALKDAAQGKAYNPYGAGKMYTNFSQDTREYVGENIAEATEGMELFGQNIPSFLYSTAMSMGDSALGAATMRQFFAPLMGNNAFHQKAKELTEAGEDADTIFKTALASGVAEAVFEYISIDKLVKIKNVDSGKRLVVEALKQSGIEGSEELLTEASNIISDTLFRGDNAELIKQYNELLERGYTEKEANTEIAKQIASQIGWATVGGALSGLAMGGGASTSNYLGNAITGKGIKSNERVSDLFDIANNPEIAEAYETYTRYANKGINADNVSNAQLGRLYNEVKADAVEKVNSKKSTDEQHTQGMTTLGQLGILATENKLAKSAKENTKDLKVGEKSDIDINDVKLKDNKFVVATDKGEVSVNDVNVSKREAELLGIAKEISKTEGEELANAFIAQYDGETDIYAYHNSFNVTMAYAKGKYSYDYILNNKGVLSVQAVKEIYKETRIKADKEQKAKFQELVKQMADKKFYKGFIDETVIDYDNTSAEGKVNWKDLTQAQREAVTFVKGFAQATGMNLVFVANNPKYNGSYDRTKNTLYINLDKGGYDAIRNIKETIIPTMSHETTHWMKEKSPELWRHLNEIVFSTLTEHYNSNTEQAIKDKIALLDRLDPKIKHTEEDARERNITEKDLIQAEMNRKKDNTEDVSREEIIARACEDLLKMSEQGRKIFTSLSEGEQKTLFEKVKAIITDLINWVNDLLNSYESTSNEARIMREYKEQLQKASKVWDKMFEDSVKVNQALEKSGAFERSKTNVENVSVFSEKEIIGVSGKSYGIGVYLDSNLLTGLTEDERKGMVKEYVTTELAGEHFVAYDSNKDAVDVRIATKSESFKNEKGKKRNVLKELYNKYNGFTIKQEAVVLIDELIANAKFDSPSQAKHKHGWLDNNGKNDWDIWTVFIQEKNKSVWEATLNIANTTNGEKILYDIGPIKMVEQASKSAKSTTNNIILNSDKNVNTKFSDRNKDVETEINTSMTMDEAKRMIHRAFVLGDIFEKHEYKYRNGEEWLRGEGVDEVSKYIEKENILTEKYFNKLQGYIDSDFRVSDVIKAYIEGTLVGSEKPKAKRLDTSKVYRINDERFYSPQRIKDAKKLLQVATQRVTEKNHNEVYSARAKLLLFSHNKGASDLLGLTQTEFYKKLRTWSSYPAKARDFSKKLNDGVADSNKWTGIENCSWLYRGTIETKDVEGLVKSIKGAANNYEIAYIARTMLAIDEHTDWSWLSFEFDTKENINKGKDPRKEIIFGYYDNDARKIVVSHNYKNTVAHEMGHALDFQWARDLGYEHTTLSDASINNKKFNDVEEKQFFDNFKLFIDMLTDSGDISLRYLQEPKETFARFVAQFIQWVDNIGTGNKKYEYESLHYNDNFSETHYIEFVKLLQEKAMLDSRKMEAETNVRYSDKNLYNGLFDVPSEVEEKLSNQIDTWLQGKMPSNEVFKLGKTPVVLKELGADDLPIVMAQDVVSKINGVKHEVSLENIRNLPKNIADPIMIFKSATVPNAFVILTEIEDTSGRPIVAALHLNKFENRLKVNRIASVYGRNGVNGFVEEQFKKGNVKYIDKIKSQQWSTSRGLQLPKLVQSIPDNNIILYKEDIVNTYNMRNGKELFSDKEQPSTYDLMGENERLLKENEKYKADVERLKERLKIEKTLTHGNRFNENQLGAVAGHLRNISNSTYDKLTLMRELKDVYSYIITSEVLAWEDIFGRCYRVAENMLEESKPEKVIDDYSKHILRNIRSTKIRLSDVQKAEAQHIFGKNWNRYFFNRVVITDSGTPIDMQWSEWADMYPDLFDRNISDTDMIGELYDIIGTLQDASEVVMEYDAEERTRWLAREIYNQYWNVSTIKTTADKYDRKIKELNHAHYNAMVELRDNYNNRLAEQKKLYKQKNRELVAKIRERKDKEIAMAKQHGRDMMSKYKENAERKTRIQRITANTLSLNELLIKNSKEKHVPEVMKPVVVELIKAIDFSSKQLLGMDGTRKDRRGTPTQNDISLSKALSKVKDMLGSEYLAKNGLVELYGHELGEDLEALVDSVNDAMRTVGDNEFVLNKMNLAELKTLEKVVGTIKQAVSKMNEFHTVHHAKGIANLSQKTMEYLDGLGQAKVFQGLRGGVEKLLNWGNGLPYYVFKRFGEGGTKIFEAFQDGWDKFAFHIKKIIDYANESYTSKEAEEWAKDIKKIIVEEYTVETIEVNTNGLEELMYDKNKARTEFVKLSKNFPKTVLNEDTNKEIGISRTGIDKFLSGNFSKEKYATGYKIPELIKTARKVSEAENKKQKPGIKGYEYYENSIKIDGKDYAVHIRVRNTDMGDKYYGHTISKDVFEIEIEPKAWNSAEKTTVHSINAIGSNESISSKANKVKKTEFQMTIPQIMSLYCLQKREQAKNHILGGGIRIADIVDKKGNVIAQSEGIILNAEDVSNIVNTLTDRQKEVADKLQKFMNTICTDWGNEVSMLRFGYKAFGEENYFPIQSDKNNLAVNDETEQNNSLFKLLNMSFTKTTVDKANNRIVISDIFDVFAQHTSDMAKYNALALPVLDAFKWYNYTEKEYKDDTRFITSGVKQSLENAFGKDAQNYITTFLKDINGEKEVSRDTLGKHFFTNAKIAAVGGNIRVALLQPTSYVRASAVIDNKYLVKALTHKPKIDKAIEHCGMALWKSMGYYDTNIQKGVEEQIKHTETAKDKLVELSMKGAEWGDKITFGYLWNACELEIRETRNDLKVGSSEFYEAIGKRLREIIYATQVVDSTMTRSQMMRSNQTYDKMLTAFASEPTLAYNMVQNAIISCQLDTKRLGKKASFKKNGKKVARVFMAYTMTNAVAALVESGFDAFRDDDDEEMDLIEFMKLYLSNFAYDMSFTAKIPYIKELVSILQGYTTSRTDTQWMQSLGYTLKGITKLAQGEGNAYTTFKNLLRSMSYLSGLPFYNVYRDTIASFTNIDLFTTEELEEWFNDLFN